MDRDNHKREALHYFKVMNELKTREANLAAKVEELESDRKWLSNQVKIVMKEKNILERRIKQDSHDTVHACIKNSNNVE